MTNPVQPSGILPKIVPVAAKKRMPSPQAQSVEPESIQPLKKATPISGYRHDIINLLLSRLREGNKEIRVYEYNDFILITTSLNTYTIYPTAIQKAILKGEPLKSSAHLEEFLIPIRCIRTGHGKNFEFHLNLLSIFLIKNPIAESFLSQIASSDLIQKFIAHAITFALSPFFSASSSFVNPTYCRQVETLIGYMNKINPKSMLYALDYSGISERKIEAKTGISIPNLELLPTECKFKSFAEIEAEEAKNIIENSPSHLISTPFLRKVAQFKETSFPIALVNALSFKVGSFEIDLTSERSYFDNPFLIQYFKKLGSSLPLYDESKTLKDNIDAVLNLLDRELCSSLKVNEDKTATLVFEGTNLKISHHPPQLDLEFASDLFFGEAPATEIEPPAPINPEIINTKVPLDSPVGGLLRILSLQICSKEIKALIYNPSLKAYEATLATGEKHSFFLKECHIDVLSKGQEMSPQDYLNAFLEPIICKIHEAEFNFSLFSLFFSKDLTRYIKVKNINPAFLVCATTYLVEPFTNSYLNPDYFTFASNYLLNLRSLSPQKIYFDNRFKDKVIHYGLVDPSKWKVSYELTLARFSCLFFPQQEAEAAITQQWGTSGITPYLDSWNELRLKFPKIVTTPTHLFDGHQNGYTKVDLIQRYIKDNIPSNHVKERVRSLLKAFLSDKDFKCSYFFYKEQQKPHYFLVETQDSRCFCFYLNELQMGLLKDPIFFHLEHAFKALMSSIDVSYITPHIVYRFKTSLMALLYERNPFTEKLVSFLAAARPSKLYDDFLLAATEFALRPFDAILYMNPDYLTVIETFYKNLCDIAGSADSTFPCNMGRPQSTMKTGSITWKLKRTLNSVIPPSSIYYQQNKSIAKKEHFSHSHFFQWEVFRQNIAILLETDTSLDFVYEGRNYRISNEPAALNPLFKAINDKIQLAPETDIQEAAPVQSYSVGFLAANLQKIARSFLFPIVDDPGVCSITTAKDQGLLMAVSSKGENYTIRFNAVQSLFLMGLIPQNGEISQDLIKPIDVFKENFVIGKTSIFALFYTEGELIDTLKTKIMSCGFRDVFLAHGTAFALHPITHTGATCNPNLIPLLKTFYRHFVDINHGSNHFPASFHRSQIILEGMEWNFKDSNITTFVRSYLASQEADACLNDRPAIKTAHVQLWRSFFLRVKFVSAAIDQVKFKDGNSSVTLSGKFLSEDPIFKRIMGIAQEPFLAKVAVVEETAPPQVLLPAPIPLSLPQATPQALDQKRIANLIETYWFQNPVNYSRWIKLLQKSRAVFSFNALPQELMEPLKGFNKEAIEAVLKYLGLGVDIAGNLEKEIVDKAVPTLLRVKAAEFKLVKKTLGDVKEPKEIEFKPCYLVKPGPRFVHVIKVIARFDENGLLSGFLMAEGNVESNISLDAFNRLVEEGKNKKAIVLQRETITLTEEQTRDEPPAIQKKREREETAETKQEESAAKEAKSDPILPPVPLARPHLKRPSTENTVKPKAPKESKFTDKSDISGVKEKALGKAQDSGIIAPPDLIDQPPAPGLKEALTLDELYSALSENAGVHVNHAVKISLNQLKAIFSEEPLVYEGLESITRLEATPLPSIPCLVPKAKSYQWDFVLEAKRRELAGLGTILAPYMGLGKTWIYISKILLSIYEEAKGHHLVITPKPLRKTIAEDAITILNDARLNAFIHLKSLKWGNYCADKIIMESNPREITFLLSLLGLFDEETFNKIMTGRGPITSRLVTTYVRGFQQYPSLIKRLFEYCKSIAPKTLPEKGAFDEKGLERIFKFSSSRIIKCEDAKDLLLSAKSDEAKIIIGSYEQAEQLAQDPVCPLGFASITFDEAQYIHNPEIKIAKAAETLLKVFNPKAKMAVTGTPIENGIEDLFQLVGLMAPELKCPSILSTLHSLSSSASRFTKIKDREQAVKHLIKFHGHLQAYLTRVSKNLVLILKKEDPRVKAAWGDGARVEYARENITLSHLADQKYKEAHELFKSRKIDPLTGKKLDSNMAYYAKVASILLDPELKAESLTKKDPAIQRLLKWIKHEPDMAKIDELVARSAILSSILYSPKTLKAIDEKRVELIFVANIAVGKVIRKVLKRKFPESLGTESYLMYGDQKDEKKDAIIDRLKESGKTKFGILSIESGSTGFSIPDAYVTIMQTLSYNVATELQAIGRMDRATSKGDKYVVYPRFGIFSEAHIPVVQEIKKLTFKNFFSPAETQLERLQDIARLIRYNIYQSFLNEKREADAALKEMEEIDAITESLTSGIEEADLEAFVQMLTPELPEIPLPPARVAAVAQATLNPPLRIKGNKLFKLPLPNSLSSEDKVRLASYIEQNRKALEGPLKEIYNQFKLADIRPLVRSDAPMPTQEAAKAYQLLLNLIDEAKRSVRSIEDIGVDRFKIDGQDYVLELKDHPDRIKRVKIVSSANGLFEILI